MPPPLQSGEGSELRTEAGREARIDIFEFHLRFYHIRLVQEISLFFRTDVFGHLSMQDLVRLMDLIVAYNDKLDEVLSSPCGTKLRERIPPFALMDNVQQMAEIYIDKLQNTLWDWMENIVRANTELADERVSENTKGKFLTPAPVDLFNLINETMVMAKSSGVEELEAAALSSCLNVLADYLTDIMEDMKETKRHSFEYVVASMNDCSAIIDNLDNLEEENEVIIKKHLRPSDFETLREKYTDALIQCIDYIADMIVVDDLADVIKERVECKGRMDEVDSAAKVEACLERTMATIEDYFSILGYDSTERTF